MSELSAKELLDYQNHVEEAVKNKQKMYFFNDNILKAMIIQKGILGDGQDDNMPDIVRMYCGQASLFIKTGKNMADNLKLQYDISELDEDEKNTWTLFNPWQNLKNALEAYINKGKTFELIVDDIEIVKDDKDLVDILSKRNVKIWHLPEPIGLNHFTTSKKSYRIEDSNTIKTATCGFNDEENAKVFFDSFNVLKRFSVNVELS